MIKEIVDIGRVSNQLGSVFTFKGLPEFYIEVVLELENKDFKFIPNPKPIEIPDKELYLDYGVFRGKSGSNIFIFPSSFIINLTSDYSKLQQLTIDLKKELDKENIDNKKCKKLENQYKIENKKFQKDKEVLIKQVQSGDKILISSGIIPRPLGAKQYDRIVYGET